MQKNNLENMSVDELCSCRCLVGGAVSTFFQKDSPQGEQGPAVLPDAGLLFSTNRRRQWLATIWLIANAKNGISSYEVHRAIKVTQKTAWFMLHRIRLAMRTGTFEKMKGEVEVDETLVGGKMRNMHGSRKKRAQEKKGSFGKSVVVGLLTRAGEVRAVQIADNKKGTLEAKVREHVEPGSTVYTDALPSYYELDKNYIHEVIDHAVAYVDGKIHTNGIENFWSLLKRMLKGTYVSVDPAHLFRYLDEQVHRYNNRKVDDAARFLAVAGSIIGRRITYKQLIGDATPA